MINDINDQSINNMVLQHAQEIENKNNLYHKNRPKWDTADPEQSLTNIWEYFESLHGTKKSPCSCLLCNDIVPLMDRNQVIGFWSDPDKKMIERCPIIPIKENHFTTTELMLSTSHPTILLLILPCAMPNSRSLWKRLLLGPASMSPARWGMSALPWDVCAAFKKVQLMYLGPGFT